jgi:hypothetical protein
LHEEPKVVADLMESCAAAVDQTSVWDLAETPPVEWAAVAPLGPCVAAWAKRHNLDVSWLIADWMYRLLEETDEGRNGEATALLCAVVPNSLATAPRPSPAVHGAVFVPLTWPYTVRDRASFEDEVLRALKARLKEELDQMEAAARAAGATPFAKRAVADHMRWLVRRVVRRQSAARIIASAPDAPTKRAVEMAIHDAARLLGLPLPRLAGGRRKRRAAHVVRYPPIRATGER